MYLPVYLSVYCIYLNLSVYLPVRLSFCRSLYLSIYLSIHLSIYLSIYLAVCLSVLSMLCLNFPSVHSLTCGSSPTCYTGPLLKAPMGYVQIKLGFGIAEASGSRLLAWRRLGVQSFLVLAGFKVSDVQAQG